jgi:hypothetical protein
MSTEVALLTGASNGLSVWRTEFDAAAQIASSLSLTDFIPESLKKRDEEGALLPNATAATIAAALLTGQELGLGPMASLRSIDVVRGTPGLRAIAMRALVLSAGHDMWVETASDTRAIVCGQRAGSEHVNRCEWDEERARRLNLWDKPEWRRQRRNMLIARATAECARLTAPERILGLGYTAEELADGAAPDSPPAAEEPPPDKPARKTRQRKRTTPAIPPLADQPDTPIATEPPPVDEPPWEHEPDDGEYAPGAPADPGEPEPPEPPRVASRAQVTKVQIGFAELGTTDRDDRLAMLSGILGRDVRSANELTADEASQVIEALAVMARERPDERR